MSAYPTCTCNAKYVPTSTTFHETEVNEEGICIKCGHYAVYKSEYELYPRSNKSIHGYRIVSLHDKPGWRQAEINTYCSYISNDHTNFEVLSGNLQLDYSGKGKGSRKSRSKNKNKDNVNCKFNRRTHL
jgi:hypothetical protein